MKFKYKSAKILEKWDSHRSSPEIEEEGYFVTQDEHCRVVELLEQEIVRLEKLEIDVSKKLLSAIIKSIKEGFADQNWEYLDFIADRILPNKKPRK